MGESGSQPKLVEYAVAEESSSVAGVLAVGDEGDERVGEMGVTSWKSACTLLEGLVDVSGVREWWISGWSQYWDSLVVAVTRLGTLPRSPWLERKAVSRRSWDREEELAVEDELECGSSERSLRSASIWDWRRLRGRTSLQ